MKNKNLAEQLFAYFIIGVAVVLGFAALIIFSWVLLWGALIGVILYLIALIRMKFIKKSTPTTPTKKTIGRTYDHDEFK